CRARPATPSPASPSPSAIRPSRRRAPSYRPLARR
ncbi:hypothetical protein EE612_044002, partial [Oryza sativa]